MQKTLYLFFSSPNDTTVSFILREGDIQISSGRDTLTHLCETHDLTNISAVAVIPGNFVVTKRVTLPKGSHRKHSKIIPFLVEDDLVRPIEANHIAIRINSPATALVSIIDRETCQTYYDIFKNIPFSHTTLIPDYLTIAPEEEILVVKNESTYLIRLPDGSGYALCGINEGLLLKRLGSLPISLRTYQPTALTTEFSQIPNLLTGEFKVDNSKFSINSYLKHIKNISILCTATLAIYFLSLGIFYNNANNHIHQKSIEIYRKLFPEDIRIINIRKQLEGHLRSGNNISEENDAITLLSIYSTSLSQNTNIKTRNINYGSDTNILRIDLEAGSLTELQSLKESLNSEAMNVNIISAAKIDTGTLATIELTHGRKP